MEKYYTVVPNSLFYKNYLEYKEMSEKVNDAFMEFAKENDIETHEYYQSTQWLHICPTNSDAEKFGKYFKKDNSGMFKKNSFLAKAWVRKCYELGLRLTMKPSVAFEFRVYGSASSRLFMINDILYASLRAVHDFENIVGFEEIKASDFFKVIEEYEESLKH